METREGIEWITDDQIREAEYVVFINHGTYFLAVSPMTYGKGRLIYAEDETSIINGWCYERYIDAVVEMFAWDNSDASEPSGWFRNPFDGRRRPGGDASKEYTRA